MSAPAPVRTGLLLGLGLLATLAAFATLATPAAAADPRSIRITGNDAMKFSLQRIDAAPGEALEVVLTAQGSMPKTEMAHNWVLLARGASVDSFVMSASMARKTDYVPAAKRDQVLAATALAGAGETVRVAFQAPTEPGEYVFLCTFPGHFAAGMKGKLVVAK
jgi:azurin